MGFTAVARKGHNSTAMLHVVGKDIVKFHGIYWPAFLLALDLPMPKQLLTHAHWTMNHKKMSKSDGNVVNPFYAIQRYGVDAMRFYMAHDGGIQSDGDYSNEQVVKRYRKELQFGLGNLCSRVTGPKFDIMAACTMHRDGVWDFDMSDILMQGLADNTPVDTSELMEKLDVPGALKNIMQLIHETNKYIQHKAPWYLVKSQQDIVYQNKIIYICCENIRVAAILLQPSSCVYI